MMRVQLVMRWDHPQQFFFNLKRGFPRRKTGSVPYPENMGIYGDRRLAERDVAHHVRGFSADTRKAF